MSRAGFGGGNDISSVFGSLINEENTRIKDAVNSSVQRAQTEQQQKDSDEYEKWTAGQISDAQWIAYIKQRIKDTAEYPDQQAQWTKTLLENQDAITDAQFETNYALGKITLGQLIDHYRQRMSAVQVNSPAYRTLAQRYAQLVNYNASGGGSRGGGGGGSGGSKNDPLLKAVTNAVVKGGGVPLGSHPGSGLYNDVGPIVADYYVTGLKVNKDGSLSTTDYDAALAGNMNLIETILDYFNQNPQATTWVDPFTGRTVSRTQVPDLQKQYTRDGYGRYAILSAGGLTGKDGKSAADVGAQMTKFISDYVQPANFNEFNDSFNQASVLLKARLMDAGSDQNAVSSAWADFGATVKNLDRKFAAVNVVQPTTGGGLQEGVDTKTVGRLNATLDQARLGDYDQARVNLAVIIADIGAHPGAYDYNSIVNVIEQAISDTNAKGKPTSTGGLQLGTGAGALNLGEAAGRARGSTLPGNVNDVLNSWTIYHGLQNEKLIDSGVDPNTLQLTVPSPQGGGSMPVLYTRVADPRTGQPVVTVGVPKAVNGVITVAPANNAGYVPTHIKVNGEDTVMWATPTRSTDPAEQYFVFGKSYTTPVNGSVGGVTYKAGDLVPSSVIKAWGAANLQARERDNTVIRTGLMTINVQGTTFYYDPKTTSVFSVRPYSVNVHDGVTGGIQVDQNGNLSISAVPNLRSVPFAAVGFTPSEYQDLVHSEIASGRLNPAQVRYYGADGTTIQTWGANDMMTWFYDPQKVAQSVRQYSDLSAAGGWNNWQADLARTQAENDARDYTAARGTSWMDFATRNPTAAGLNPHGDVAGADQAMLASVKNFSAGLGINLSGNKPDVFKPTEPSRSGFQPGLDNTPDTHVAALTAQVNRMKKMQNIDKTLAALNFTPPPTVQAALPPSNPAQTQPPATPKLPTLPAPPSLPRPKNPGTAPTPATDVRGGMKAGY